MKLRRLHLILKLLKCVYQLTGHEPPLVSKRHVKALEHTTKILSCYDQLGELICSERFLFAKQGVIRNTKGQMHCRRPKSSKVTLKHLVYKWSCTDYSRSQYSDWLLAGGPMGQSWSPGRVKNFLFSTLSRPALGSTQPPIQWVLVLK
jgi:hypothetical protein